MLPAGEINVCALGALRRHHSDAVVATNGSSERAIAAVGEGKWPTLRNANVVVDSMRF